MIVDWSPRAGNQVRSIWIYLSERNPTAAVRTIRAITVAGNSLAEQPNRGRPSQAAGLRELVVLGTPYVIVYRVTRERVEMAALLHGAQRRPSG